MLRQQMKKARRKRGPTRFRGICADAEALGVTREHLWLVLTGHRVSRPLSCRYRDLKRGE
jgi:hypothetical protein